MGCEILCLCLRLAPLSQKRYNLSLMLWLHSWLLWVVNSPVSNCGAVIPGKVAEAIKAFLPTDPLPARSLRFAKWLKWWKHKPAEPNGKHVVPFICIHVCEQQNAKANSKVCCVQMLGKGEQVAGELFNVYSWTWFEPFIYEMWNGRGDTGVNCFQQHTHTKSLALSVQMWAIIVIYLMPVKIEPHEGRPCWIARLPVWVSPWVNLRFMQNLSGWYF